jgi:hypothetical protein
MKFEEIIALLQTIDSEDPGLNFLAERYDSACAFHVLVVLAKPPVLIDQMVVRNGIRNISYRCVDDGADFGNIPGLGGKEKEVWDTIRKATQG